MVSRRVLLGGLAVGALAAGGLALRGKGASAQTATGADGAVCTALPGETAGPFPADGTNARAGATVNVLTEADVIRSDIRPSFAGMAGTAEGVPLTLTIRIVDVGAACAPLPGRAMYLWQCDAAGDYSLYSRTDINWLRGMQVSDATGVLSFTTIVPGCYDGRWPHLHFEIFASVQAAATGRDAVLTSQFALPEGPCAAVYAGHPAYAGSAANMARLSLSGDMVFRDNGAALDAMTLVMTGDPVAGYAATVTVGIA